MCPDSKQHRSIISRRAFVRSSLKLAAGLALYRPINSYALYQKTESLSFYHTHTHESLAVNFNELGDPEALRQIHVFLRDFRTGDVHPIDNKLLKLLFRIKKASRSQGTFEVISGYRSPETNRALRKKSSGVAKKSLHMSGQAIDVRLSDLRTRSLRDIASSMQKGGVGFYPQSDFVHLDTGRVRQW
jgi:uncharacterized protein YcbK (DUF882 family)